MCALLMSSTRCGRTTHEDPPADPVPTPDAIIPDPPAAAPTAPVASPSLPPPLWAACPAPLDETTARDGEPATAPTAQDPCLVTEYDSDGPDAVTARTFDAQLHVLTETFDRVDEPPRRRDLDTRPPHTKTSHEYDLAGHRIHTWLDANADGTNDVHNWWSFDAVGNEVVAGASHIGYQSVTTRTFMPIPGSFVLRALTVETSTPDVLTSFTRRADGLPLTREHSRGGALEDSTVWTYAANGSTTMVESSTRRLKTTVTNAAGRPIEIHDDEPRNGVDDYVETFTYDAAGRPLHYVKRGLSPIMNGEVSYAYDAIGRQIERVQHTLDSTNGATITYVEKRTFAGCGHDESVERSTNGVPQTRILRSYDGSGYLVSEETRQLAPVPSTSKVTRTFDANGRLTSMSNWTLEGTEWKESVAETRTYDASGHLTSVVRPTYWSETSTYDAKGRLTLRESTQISPGDVVRQERSYACLP